MTIEINKDIDRYQESIVMGLTAKQLIYSIASVAVGATLVLLLYKYIGLTGAAYVAIPCVAPIALGGFWTFNGMSFYEYWGKKFHFMFGNRALLYVSTEGEPAIRQMQMEGLPLVGLKAKKKKRTDKEKDIKEDVSKKQDEFEASKAKMKKMLYAFGIIVIAIVIGLYAYKKYFM